MSVEHAIKRVAKEIGNQSVELAEELTLTTAEWGGALGGSAGAGAPRGGRVLAATLTAAELSFLEDRHQGATTISAGAPAWRASVKAVMQALIQAERHGTSVGTALRVMAEEGREQAHDGRAEKKAAALRAQAHRCR